MGAKLLFILFFLGCLYSFSGQFYDNHSFDSSGETQTAARRLDDYGDSHDGSGDSSMLSSLFKKTKSKVRKVERRFIRKDQPAVASTTVNTKNHASAFQNVEEMNMNLIQVINSKKFKKPLKEGEFSGHLYMRDGNIESMLISLPNNVEVAVNYSDLQGNTFRYDMDGEEYRGAVFKASGKKANLYMITLNGGPLDQTRLKFQSTGEEFADRIPAEDFLDEKPVDELAEAKEKDEEVIEEDEFSKNEQEEDDQARFNFS